MVYGAYFLSAEFLVTWYTIKNKINHGAGKN